MMKEELDELLRDIASRTFESEGEVEAFRVEFLGRQGKMKGLMAQSLNQIKLLALDQKNKLDEEIAVFF